MLILQFRATNPVDVQAAIGAMLLTVNAWSLLDWRARNDQGQITQAWGADIFRQHTTDLSLWWVDWTSIHVHLGEIGQQMAALNIGTPDDPGILIGNPLGARAITLHLIEVPDLVAAGYVEAGNA